MKETVKLCIALGLTCLVAGSILVFAKETTDARVEQAKLREKENALAQVLGDFANQPLKDKQTFGDITFYIARNAEGAITAIAGEGSPVENKGFGGEMKVMVGLNPDGVVETVIVTENKETPGLGTNATDRKRTRSLWSLFGGGDSGPAGLPPNPYLDRYDDHMAKQLGASDFKVVKHVPKQGENGIQGITGATISSRAVGNAVHHICAAFDENREALLK
jgi:electron transport complex protein RnfG